MQTINAPPTWAAVMPLLVHWSHNGTTTTARQSADHELTRMAQQADTLPAALQALRQIAALELEEEHTSDEGLSNDAALDAMNHAISTARDALAELGADVDRSTDENDGHHDEFVRSERMRDEMAGDIYRDMTAASSNEDL